MKKKFKAIKARTKQVLKEYSKDPKNSLYRRVEAFNLIDRV